MVADQIEARGVTDPRVLAAMAALPRHRFVPHDLAARAYEDHPLPIGRGQTISQPYVVAFMAQALQLQGTEKVLEVGSGSGYMAAVLGRLAGAVYGLELEPDLLRGAQAALAALDLPNVRLRQGDGALGWPEEAPFDVILLSCATDHIPPALWEQLTPRGRLLLPLDSGLGHQLLTLAGKDGTGPQSLLPVVFVPLR